MVSVPVINQSPHPLPEYKTQCSAGMDLMAWVEAPVQLQPLERRLISTGLFMALPQGYEAQIRPRSGIAIHKGITLINTPGTIDSDYRGEIKIPVINLSGEIQTIENGERIAQMIIAPVVQCHWQIATSLDDTQRGSGGFGHTGM